MNLNEEIQAHVTHRTWGIAMAVAHHIVHVNLWIEAGLGLQYSSKFN
jgi:hypothetical protein